MKADPQRRQSVRPFSRILGGCGSNHQACSRENSEAVRLLDRLVHRQRKPEVVPCDDDPLQERISRATSRPSLVRMN